MTYGEYQASVPADEFQCGLENDNRKRGDHDGQNRGNEQERAALD